MYKFVFLTPLRELTLAKMKSIMNIFSATSMNRLIVAVVLHHSSQRVIVLKILNLLVFNKGLALLVN